MKWNAQPSAEFYTQNEQIYKKRLTVIKDTIGTMGESKYGLELISDCHLHHTPRLTERTTPAVTTPLVPGPEWLEAITGTTFWGIQVRVFLILPCVWTAQNFLRHFYIENRKLSGNYPDCATCYKTASLMELKLLEEVPKWPQYWEQQGVGLWLMFIFFFACT